MGLLASTFTNDEDRGHVMGIAIAGISVGIIGKHALIHLSNLGKSSYPLTLIW